MFWKWVGRAGERAVSVVRVRGRVRRDGWTSRLKGSAPETPSARTPSEGGKGRLTRGSGGRAMRARAQRGDPAARGRAAGRDGGGEWRIAAPPPASRPPERPTDPQRGAGGRAQWERRGRGGGGRAQRGARGARGRGRCGGGGRRQRGESQRHHPPRLRIGGFAKTTGGRLRKRPDSPVVMPSRRGGEQRGAE